MSAEDTANQVVTEPTQVEDTFDYGTANNGAEVVPDETTSEDATLSSDADVSEPEEESEELDIEGYKFAIPKSKAEKLKAERMMHRDYTQKTMEVAEHRKAVEQEREFLANQAKAQQENIQEYAQLVAIGQRVQQFDQVNWAQLNHDDPVTAQKLWIERSQLIEAQNTVAGRLQQKEQQQAREREQKTSEAKLKEANQVRECFEVVARDIKGWSPELANAITKTGNALGFSDEELKSTFNKDPRFVKLLHKAHIAEQLAKKQAVAPQKPQVKPVPQVGAGSAPAGQRVEELEMGDYIKARRAQLRR